MTTTLYQGNALEVLPRLEASRVQCVCTSPPFYGLRDYGITPSGWPDGWNGCLGLEPTPARFLSHLVQIFAQLRRVLRPDGVLWINMADSYSRNPARGGSGPNGKHDYIPSDGDARRLMSESHGSSDGRACRIPEKSLMLIPQRLAIALSDDGWIVRQVFPWIQRCLSGGTWVYAKTQKGEMPMTVKDLVRLRPETVQLWNGTRWTQVLGFQQRLPSLDHTQVASKHVMGARTGQEMLFPPEYLEIELQSGERIGCTADHRWPTMRGLLSTSELCVGDILESTTLPEPEHLRIPGMLHDEVIGWFIGLYLAEGCKDDGIIKLTGHVLETEARSKKLQEIADLYHGSLRVQKPRGKAQDICLSGKVLHGILDTYIAGDSALTKRLTSKCWQRSNAFLSALLLGYLEGDGSWQAKEGRWRLVFGSNDRLAIDFRTLGARLGVTVRLRRGKVRAVQGGKFHKRWQGSVRLDHNEKSQWTQFRRLPDTQIVAIRASRAKQYWDIAVADEPHIFALASGILTHNSAMPGSQRDRATSVLQWWLMLTQQPHYFSDMEAVRQQATWHRDNNPDWQYQRAKTNSQKHPTNRNGQSAGFTKWDHAQGRTYRNTDLWMQSLTAPYGLVGVGDELVGLDCTAQARQDGHYATFAPELITPLVQQSVSAYGACGVCGAPWARDKVSKKCDTLQHGTLHLPEMSSTTSSRSLWERPPEAERASTLVPEMRCAPSKARSSEGFREREASCEAIQNEQSGKSGLAKAALSTNTTGENAEYCRNTTLFGETGSAGEKEAAASDLAKDRESQNKWSDPLQQEKSVAPQSGGGICSGRLDQDSTTTEPSLFLLQETLHQNSPSDNRSCDSVDARGKSQPNEHCSSVPRVQQSKVESSHASSLDHWIPTCPHPEAPVVPCTILDPFSGTGTTVLVAQRLGLHGIGIELSADYVAHTIERLTGDAPLLANIREGGTL